MNVRVAFLSAAAALIVTGLPAIAAGDAHAPPALTPLAARDAVAACPGTAQLAAALVRGADEASAAAGARAFDACAAAHRHDGAFAGRWAASTAVGAAYLSLALLRNGDPALLRRAVDATAEQRSVLAANDATVRAWPIIPDAFDVRRNEAIVYTDCPANDVVADAAYINVAAKAGNAWVTTPRAATACPALAPQVAGRFSQPRSLYDANSLASWSAFGGRVGGDRDTIRASDVPVRDVVGP